MLIESFYQKSIQPEALDRFLSEAWRHFGEYFFRYKVSSLETGNTVKFVKVIPLRICLENFQLSKSQRKILQKNAFFSVKKQLIKLYQAKYALFKKHALRFSPNTRPSSLHDFVSDNPESVPLPTYEIEVWDKNRLIACSFVDITTNAFSSIYAMFDTDYARYSLGIFTLLKEIEWAQNLGKKYLYLGYAYDVNSFYDYKKRFSGLESYNWEKSRWEPFTSHH